METTIKIKTNEDEGDRDEESNLCKVLDEEIAAIIKNNNEIQNISKSTGRENKNKNKTILVLSGGGTKCAAHIGAAHGLLVCGMLENINTIACASGGGMIGVLMLCGYTPKQILTLLIGIGTDKLMSKKRANFLTEFGLESGNRFIMIFGKILSAKGFSPDVTFEEFYQKTQKNLILTGTCLNNKKPYYFHKDTYPNMKVLKALRITISLPPLFTPVKFEGKLFVDGGFLDNYPIRLFSDRIDQVVGVYLNGKRDYIQEINHLEGYFSALFSCILEGMAKSDSKGYEEYTTYINLAVDFSFGVESNSSSLKESFDCGFRAIMKRYGN